MNLHLYIQILLFYLQFFKMNLLYFIITLRDFMYLLLKIYSHHFNLFIINDFANKMLKISLKKHIIFLENPNFCYHNKKELNN